MSLSEIKQLVSVAFQAGRMDAQFEMGLRSTGYAERMPNAISHQKDSKSR